MPSAPIWKQRAYAAGLHRDISPGEDFPTAIVNAITQSRARVLVFSANSNSSEEVSRELYLAAKAKVVIIPFRIEEVEPEAGKQYYLGRTHWLDAMNPPTREQIRALVELIKSFVPSAKESGIVQASERTGLPAATATPATRSRFRLRLIAIPAVVLAAALFAGIGLFANSRQPDPTSPPTIAVVAAKASSSATATESATGVPASPTTLTPISTSTPASTATNTATRTPSVAATIAPTAGSPEKILLQEHFDNALYDGDLPPSIMPMCIQGQVQKAGALHISPNDQQNCGTHLVLKATANQVQSLQSRFKVAASSEMQIPPVSIGVGLMPGNDPQNSYNLGCGINTLFKCSSGYPNKGIKGDIDSPTLSIKADTWYTLRLDLANPDTLEWLVYLENKRVGTFAFPSDLVSQARDLPLEFSISQSPLSASAPVVYIDDIVVTGR